MRAGGPLAAALVAALVAAPAPAPAAPQVVDAFEDAAAWKPMPADGVEMKLSNDAGAVGRSLRADFRFVKGGGYAVLHRDLKLDLPGNYRFVFRVRGECPVENLEFKLIDSSGANVWWCNRRDFTFPRDWQRLSTRKRQISFAWGPAGGGEIRHVAAIEFAITAGSGGSGTVWLDQLELEPLPPPSAGVPRPLASATSEVPEHRAALAVDGDSATVWRSRAGDRLPALTLDLGVTREFSAILVDWVGGERLRDYAVEASEDARAWSPIREVRDGGRSRDWLYLPEHEARWLRLRATKPVRRPCAIAEVTIEPVEWAKDENEFFEHVAKASPRGWYPRGMSGEQAYWTVVGNDRGHDQLLMSEDGAVEVGKGMWSIEPFLIVGGRVLSWADVRRVQSLDVGEVPIPSVSWTTDSLALTITALHTSGYPASICYRLRGRRSSRVNGRLAIAIRPFQVNPPSQFLNGSGGVAHVHSLEPGYQTVTVDAGHGLVICPGRWRRQLLIAPFGTGNIVEMLSRSTSGATRDTTSGDMNVTWFGSAAPDAEGHTSGLLVLPEGDLDLQLDIPTDGPPSARYSIWHPKAETFDYEIMRSEAEWRLALGPVHISLPDTAIAHSLRAQIGWILASRDSAALRPGTRAYARSWIRDGALMSAALLRMGRADAVREFIEWFAPYQYENGKVPCCVDQRGSDPVPEHDSHGEFIYLVAEYLRFTGDTALARRMWPHVAAAAAYLDTLRAQRLTPEWQAPDQREFYGVLPPSISHEGYSAKPMHSYWDDLFALRGYEDAAWLAGRLGLTAERARIARSRDEFARHFKASVVLAMQKHHIDYVPGCADLGDFDATSTTIALDPVQAESLLGRPALQRTFERYWEFFRERRDGRKDWEAYTPYEMRTIGAFVRLGWRDRADSLLQWFMQGQRPAGWRQWPEVVWKDARTPHFLGDLPHAWVGSDFVRSVLDMFAYERESDSALVVGAGIPRRWLRTGDGVGISKLHTTRGELSYTMRASGRAIEARIESGVRLSPAGLLLSPPEIGPRWTARVNGRPVRITSTAAIRITSLPATVRLTPP